MPNKLKDFEFIDTHIISILPFINQSDQHHLALKVLTSNLDILNTLNVELPTSCSEKLATFLLCYINNVDEYQDADTCGDIKRVIVSILNLQKPQEKLRITKLVLHRELVKIDELSTKFPSNDEVLRKLLCRHLKLIEVFLINTNDICIRELFYDEIKLLFDKLIVKFFVEGEKHVLSQILPLLLIYLQGTEDWVLFRLVHSEILEKVLNDDNFADVYLTFVSFFIDSTLGIHAIVGTFNSKKFWKALCQCYTNVNCERKHINHILKFVVFNLGQVNVEGIWSCQHLKNFESWWKKYFIIAEILEEKQTHLILPVFSLFSDLVNDPVVRNDMFWILMLFRSALEHDSRTIRVKAIFSFLKVNLKLYQNIHFPIVINLFFSATNDSAFYRKLFKTNEIHEFESTVVAWINDYVNNHKENNFFNLFVTLIGQVKWSPIPLYYFLDILNRTNMQPLVNMEVTMELKGTVSNITRFHNVEIRAAIQCLFIRFITKICTCKPEELIHLFDFLNCFNYDECLLRGVHAWSSLVTYLNRTVSFQLYERLISEKLDLKIDYEGRSSENIILFLARDILLAHDVFGILDKNNSIQSRVEKMVLSFSSAIQNAYVSTKIQDNYLMLIISLYNMVRNDSKVKTSSSSCPTLIPLIEENSVFIFSYIVQRMMKSENNIELLNFYESCLLRINRCIIFFLKNINSVSLLNEWWNKCIINYKSQKEHSTYCCTKILLWIYEVVSKNRGLCRIQNFDELNLIIREFINVDQKLLQNTSSAVVSGTMTNYTNTMWNILKNFIKFESSKFFKCFEIPLIIDFILDSLDRIRKESLLIVLKTLKYLLSFDEVLTLENSVHKLMECSWKKLEEIQSSPHYYDCLKYWIRSFFQKSVVYKQNYQNKIENYIDLLLKIVAENGGQSFRYIILVLNEFENIEYLFQNFPRVSYCLVNMFSVTHVDRKDQRMEQRTENHIRDRQNAMSVNQIKKFDSNNSSEVMRLKALNIILKLDKNGDESIASCSNLIKLLTSIDKNSCKRYFNDSAIHRTKHKQLQLLLIVETIMYNNISNYHLDSFECPNLLYEYAVNCLLTEPHQPSVRYMLEWLLIRLILHYPTSLFEKFWNTFSEASEERIGSICSFISVAFHVSNASENQLFLNQSVNCILPWSMGQHFNARLYAQTVLVKLINKNNEMKNKYEVIEGSLNNCLKKGNAVKNSLKLQQDFYFNSFHPVNHFSLLMILWDLPRLSGLCREEWISKNLFEKYLFVERDNKICLFHQPDIFSSVISSTWIAKAASAVSHNDNEVLLDKNDKEILLSNFAETQRKFIPIENFSNIKSPNSRSTTQCLIVVASLIDRTPNLGGLTRTCEIFSVSQLVIHNLDIIRSKEFTSLSLTAEKHVHIKEVKRQNLFDYLRKLKEEEFCIVGAEQTTNSVHLQAFSFPHKSVIVLGNEKEGIPASLLPVLDVCVEIPQSGVIRSLNVHVSASLLVWEYVKQQFFGFR